MSYKRVVPRDLFNESKLLKCLGQLVLFVQERKLPGVRFDFESKPKRNSEGYDEEYTDFEIDQCSSDAYLYSETVKFYRQDSSYREFYVRLPYNSRDAYPLLCRVSDDVDIKVFNEDGSLNSQFIEFTKAK